MALQFARQNNPSRSARHVASGLSARSRFDGSAKSTVLAVLICLGALFLSGCVDDVPELVSDDPVLQQGRDVYVARCVNCHGPTGGGGLGAKLADGEVVKNYPDVADQIDVVTNGKGTMAAFKDTLTEEEIDAVVRYTREGL